MDKELKKLQDAAGKAGNKEARKYKFAAMFGGFLVFLASHLLLGFGRDTSYIVAAMYVFYVLMAFNLILIARAIQSKKGE